MTLKLIPYLIMQGNAKEAIAFYTDALGAETLLVQAFGDMPQNPNFPIPEPVLDKIAHAHLRIGVSELMLFDNFPGSPYVQGNNITVCIMVPDAAKARAIFDALAEGGQVKQAMEETFFSPAYGTVTDRFGITFTVSAEAKQA